MSPFYNQLDKIYIYRTLFFLVELINSTTDPRFESNELIKSRHKNMSENVRNLFYMIQHVQYFRR